MAIPCRVSPGLQVYVVVGYKVAGGIESGATLVAFADGGATAVLAAPPAGGALEVPGGAGGSILLALLLPGGFSTCLPACW